MDVGSDLYACSVMVLAGIVLGLSFDLHEGFRRLAGVRGLYSFLSDLAYACMAGLFLSGCLIVSNWGELRWYALAALAGGIWAYAYLGSQFVRAGLGWMENTAKRVTGFLASRRKPPR